MLIVIIHISDKKTGMLTRLSDKSLKSEYHAGFKKVSNDYEKSPQANVASHSVLTQKSEINLND